jgi:hypothetical protein
MLLQREDGFGKCVCYQCRSEVKLEALEPCRGLMLWNIYVVGMWNIANSLFQQVQDNRENVISICSFSHI